MKVGLYKGKVVNNYDTEGRGRLLVKIPSLGVNWKKYAESCVPFIGVSKGVFLIPDVNTLVWVMFENGDENKPVWIGGTWAVGQIPETNISKKTIKTKSQSIVLEDDGALTINSDNDIILGTGASKGVVRKGDKTVGHRHTATFTLMAGTTPVTGTITLDIVKDEMDESSSKVKAKD